MKCDKKSDSKSEHPSTDRSCRKIDSGVKKDIKSHKVCEKQPAPGCKVPEHVSCGAKPKEMIPCKKKTST
ncbi:hypothetical protein L9F63_006018 [Diploptera punctata]|uniref:Uncharacterized protein n=1 Tax=Diploptera punctata TaxID=6984 RepID=A0AAD7ZBL7_DIPPU|nr:hypothetical protein L9F63_006018 [Diploptera punctata]